MSDKQSDPDAFVELLQVPSPALAQMLASYLEAAGIPTTTPGSQLKDEFAAFGQLTGLVGCTVCVPAGKVEEARRVLQEAKEAGEDLDASLDDDAPSAPLPD